MLKKTGLIAGAAMLALCAGTSGAWADSCSGRDHTGATVGGALLGGLVGGLASHGNGAAIAGGAIFGGLAGNAISRDIDCRDREYAGRAYHDSFYGDVGHRYEWEGVDHGYVVTNREYYRGHHLCRDFTQVVYRHGREYSRDGTACLRHGEWEFET